MAVICQLSARGDANATAGRTLRALHRSVALAPAVWLLLFASIVIRARVVLGFWPYPGGSDPSLPGFEGIYPSPLDPKEFPLHHAAVWLLLLIAGHSVFFMAGLLTGSVKSKLLGHASVWNFAHFAGWALLLLFVFADPGHFFEWYLD